MICDPPCLFRPRSVGRTQYFRLVILNITQYNITRSISYHPAFYTLFKCKIFQFIHIISYKIRTYLKTSPFSHAIHIYNLSYSYADKYVYLDK